MMPRMMLKHLYETVSLLKELVFQVMRRSTLLWGLSHDARGR